MWFRKRRKGGRAREVTVDGRLEALGLGHAVGGEPLIGLGHGKNGDEEKNDGEREVEAQHDAPLDRGVPRG